jgi:hypothetical protein
LSRLVAAALTLAVVAAALPGTARATTPSGETAPAATPTIGGVGFNFLESLTDDELKKAIEAKRAVEFRIEVSGEGFGTSIDGVTVTLVDAGTGERKTAKVASVTETRILANASAPIGTVFNPIEVKIGQRTLSSNATLSIKVAPTEIKEFEFKMAATADPLYKNLYSLVLTAPDDSFASDVGRNTIDIVPGGFSNLQIMPTSNTRRLLATFLAPEKFEVKDIVATVYNPSGSPTPIKAVGKLVKEFKANPNQPKIESTEVLFLQRSQGLARLKIVGSGFGTYASAPVSPEDMFYVWRWRNIGLTRRNPKNDCRAGLIRDEKTSFRNDEERKRYEQLRQLEVDYCAARLRAEEALAKLYDLYFSDLPVATTLDVATADIGRQRPGGLDVVEKMQFDQMKAFLEQRGLDPQLVLQEKWLATIKERVTANPDAAKGLREWRADIRQRLRILPVLRNASFRVDDINVLYADDKMIDVVFRFSKFDDHSEPFRLAGVTVDVVKPVVKTQKLTVNKIVGVAESKSLEPFVVSSRVGPKMDENLEYRYSILDQDSARYLFGRGVSENFFVIQLSLVNKGAKKVAVPLAAIQAEVEWRSPDSVVNAGSGRTVLERKDKKKTKVPFVKDPFEANYIEGPPTLPPMPLAGVSGYFDVYTKTQGKKARFFNILNGIAIFGATLTPFFGPGVADAHVIFTSGLIPGLKTAFGDLSGQQLQNLTALSWENVQNVPAAGGSIEKFLYIPRKYAITSDTSLDGQATHISVTHIWGLEVTGYEVVESEPITAAPQQGEF